MRFFQIELIFFREYFLPQRSRGYRKTCGRFAAYLHWVRVRNPETSFIDLLMKTELILPPPPALVAQKINNHSFKSRDTIPRKNKFISLWIYIFIKMFILVILGKEMNIICFDKYFASNTSWFNHLFFGTSLNIYVLILLQSQLPFRPLRSFHLYRLDFWYNRQKSFFIKFWY